MITKFSLYLGENLYSMAVIEKNTLKSIFSNMSETDIRKYIEDKYRHGYLRGREDERHITDKVKFRYCILLKWLIRELSEIDNEDLIKTMDKILNSANEYIFENHLMSGLNSDNINQQVAFQFPKITKKIVKK